MKNEKLTFTKTFFHENYGHSANCVVEFDVKASLIFIRCIINCQAESIPFKKEYSINLSLSEFDEYRVKKVLADWINHYKSHFSSVVKSYTSFKSIEDVFKDVI